VGRIISDISVLPLGGEGITEVLKDANTQIGITVQVRGEDVTVTSPTCALNAGGSTSVSLSPTASSGEVTATISASNIGSLGIEYWDIAVASWGGTIPDGSSSQELRYTQYFVVTSSRFPMPFRYSDLVRRYPQAEKDCALPSGQTNFWNQIQLGLQEFRDDLDRQGGNVARWLVANPATLRGLATAYALHEWTRWMHTMQNGTGNYWLEEAEGRWAQRITQLWSDTRSRIAVDAVDNGTKPSTVQQGLRPVRFWTGDTNYGGGPL